MAVNWKPALSSMRQAAGWCSSRGALLETGLGWFGDPPKMHPTGLRCLGFLDPLVAGNTDDFPKLSLMMGGDVRKNRRCHPTEEPPDWRVAVGTLHWLASSQWPPERSSRGALLETGLGPVW